MGLIKYFKKVKLERKNAKLEKEQQAALLRKQRYQNKKDKETWGYIVDSVDLFKLRGKVDLFTTKSSEVLGEWYFDDKIALTISKDKRRIYRKQHEHYASFPYYSQIDVKELQDENGDFYKEEDSGVFRFKIENKTTNKVYAEKNAYYVEPYETRQHSSDIILALERDMARKFQTDPELIKQFNQDHQLYSRFAKSLNLQKAQNLLESDLSFQQIELKSVLPGKIYMEKIVQSSYGWTSYKFHHKVSPINTKIIAERNYGFAVDPFGFFRYKGAPMDEIFTGPLHHLHNKKELIKSLKSIKNLDEKLDEAFQQSTAFYQKQLDNYKNKKMINNKYKDKSL